MSNTTIGSMATAAYGIAPTTTPTPTTPNDWYSLIPPTPPFVDPGDLPSSARLQKDGTVRIAEEDLMAMLTELKDLREKVKEYDELKAKLEKIQEALK